MFVEADAKKEGFLMQDYGVDPSLTPVIAVQHRPATDDLPATTVEATTRHAFLPTALYQRGAVVRVQKLQEVWVVTAEARASHLGSVILETPRSYNLCLDALNTLATCAYASLKI